MMMLPTLQAMALITINPSPGNVALPALSSSMPSRPAAARAMP
ncbi:hypothetical protein SAMN03159353_104026 [Cedecea sp. NFIX57]|nr:hypothetical protein SAMN03159353_104026 [Cedecea sp. NFIX57]